MADDNDTQTSIGIGLAMARCGAGLSQTDLRAALGVSAAFLSMVERGHRDPSWSLVTRWARACGYLPSEVVAMGERAARARTYIEPGEGE